jgi:hypothetical protein
MNSKIQENKEKEEEQKHIRNDMKQIEINIKSDVAQQIATGCNAQKQDMQELNRKFDFLFQKLASNQTSTDTKLGMSQPQSLLQRLRQASFRIRVIEKMMT